MAGLHFVPLSEVWKAIPGHDGYEASTFGRLRSIDKRLKLRNRWGTYDWRNYKGRMLVLVPNASGYLRVKLGAHFDGCEVHKLVALTFFGPPPEGMIVCHIDDNGHNNRIDNLRYGTYASNYADCVRNGKANRGVRHYRAKLTEQAVREIRKSTLTISRLARKHGVSPTTIHNAKTGRNWGWLDGDN